MAPLTPHDSTLTALLAAAYRLGLAAGRGGGAGLPGSLGVSAAGGISGSPQTGSQVSMAPPGGSQGAPNGGQGGSSGLFSAVDPPPAPAHAPAPLSDVVALLQHAAQQNIAATLRDDSMRHALSQSEQRRQALEIARWAQLASMRGTPTRGWSPPPSAIPFPY